MIDFARPEISQDDIAEVTRVLRNGWITTGEECALLESELSAYLGCPEVVTFSSCTAALETALAGLRLQSGAPVGIPTWTFPSTALVAVRLGLQAVLLDVDPDTLNLGVPSLEAGLRAGLQAVVGVHFAGTPLSPAVHDACRSFGVPLIEDAAHALGATDDRGKIGGGGSSVACFSFYATKNITTVEGGALATDNAELANFCRSFRLHGLSRDAWKRYGQGASPIYDVVAPGIKGNMSDVSAALGRSQLRRFEDMQERRAKLVARYRLRLGHHDSVRLVPSAPSPGSAHHLMVVILPDKVARERVIQAFSAERIGYSVHFTPLHRYSWFRESAAVRVADVTVSERLADRVLSLPLRPSLKGQEVDRVCDVLLDALRR